MATRKTASKIGVYGSRGGVIVSGLSASQVRKAIGLLTKKNGRKVDSAKQKSAMKLYDMAKRFFKLNGRFKKHYKRKTKPAGRRKAAG